MRPTPHDLRILTGGGYSIGMATSTKATAQQSRNTKTKANKAGAQARLVAPTKAQVAKAYAEAIATAKGKGVKPPYQPSQAFLSAILRAFAVASLTEAGISTAKGEAGARRDHARKVKAGKVTPDMVVHANHNTATEGVGVFTDRAENTVRARLQGFCKVMGYPADTLYAVRGDKYEAGEVGGVFILRK